MISVLFKVTRMTDSHVTVQVRAGTATYDEIREGGLHLAYAGALMFRAEEWDALKHTLPHLNPTLAPSQAIKVEVE